MTGSCVSASVQPASASGASARPRVVVAAGDDDGHAGLGHARDLRERVVQRGGADVAALEDVAGDHERVRAALDGERADAREGLALGGADARPDARIEARAGGVQVAIRGVDDPQHGCRSLALRSAGAALRVGWSSRDAGVRGWQKHGRAVGTAG